MANFDNLTDRQFDALTDNVFDELQSGPALIFDNLTDADFDALLDVEFDALASYTIHSPFAVGNANDYTSLYIVTNAEDYAT